MAQEGGWDSRAELLLLGGATVFLAVLPIALLFAPVPLAAIVARRDMRAGMITAVVSAIIAWFLSQNPLMLAQVLLGLALGVAIGEGLREGMTSRQILIVGTGVTVVTTVLLKIAVEHVLGESIYAVLAEFWQEVLTESTGNGTSVPTDLVDSLVLQVRNTFPASLLLGSAGLAVVNFALVTRLMDRLTKEKSRPRLPGLGTWRFSNIFSVVFAGGWIIGWMTSGLGGAGEALNWWQLVFANAMFVLGTLITVQGIAVAWHYLRRSRLPTLVAALIVASALLTRVVPILFLLAGLIDGWINLRGLWLREGRS